MATATATAKRLGNYRRDLIAEGIDEETVRILVIEAARALLREGDLR